MICMSHPAPKLGNKPARLAAGFSSCVAESWIIIASAAHRLMAARIGQVRQLRQVRQAARRPSGQTAKPPGPGVAEIRISVSVQRLRRVVASRADRYWKAFAGRTVDEQSKSGESNVISMCQHH